MHIPIPIARKNKKEFAKRQIAPSFRFCRTQNANFGNRFKRAREGKEGREFSEVARHRRKKTRSLALLMCLRINNMPYSNSLLHCTILYLAERIFVFCSRSFSVFRNLGCASAFPKLHGLYVLFQKSTSRLHFGFSVVARL
jgi:hypothetical protein